MDDDPKTGASHNKYWIITKDPKDPSTVLVWKNAGYKPIDEVKFRQLTIQTNPQSSASTTKPTS